MIGKLWYIFSGKRRYDRRIQKMADDYKKEFRTWDRQALSAYANLLNATAGFFRDDTRVAKYKAFSEIFREDEHLAQAMEEARHSTLH